MATRRERNAAALHEEELRNRITLLHSNIGRWERAPGFAPEQRRVALLHIYTELDELGWRLIRHRREWPVRKRST